MENDQINAINAIKKLYELDYPYAASLLIYTIIERILKIYIIQHKKDSNLINHKFEKNKFKEISNFIMLNDDDFFSKFILKQNITLGDIPHIINNLNKNFSKSRNDIVHSNIYLLSDYKKNKEDQKKINNDNYLQAIKDLDFVLSEYTEIDYTFNNNTISVNNK